MIRFIINEYPSSRCVSTSLTVERLLGERLLLYATVAHCSESTGPTKNSWQFKLSCQYIPFLGDKFKVKLWPVCSIMDLIVRFRLLTTTKKRENTEVSTKSYTKLKIEKSKGKILAKEKSTEKDEGGETRFSGKVTVSVFTCDTRHVSVKSKNSMYNIYVPITTITTKGSHC